MNRFVPQIRAVHEMVAKGRLGELFMVEGSYIHDMRNVYVRTPWRIDPERPQNPWIAGASHAMDLVRWLGGDVEEIMMYENRVKGTAAALPLPGLWCLAGPERVAALRWFPAMSAVTREGASRSRAGRSIADLGWRR